MASSDVVYVFVAAIASSGPAASSRTWSEAFASGLEGSFVIASVGAPCRAAASMTPTMSGDAPDWLIPMTSAPPTRGSAPYSDTTDGVASPTTRRFRTPSRYWA